MARLGVFLVLAVIYVAILVVFWVNLHQQMQKPGQPLQPLLVLVDRVMIMEMSQSQALDRERISIGYLNQVLQNLHQPLSLCFYMVGVPPPQHITGRGSTTW